jgi:hypothetical protein
MIIGLASTLPQTLAAGLTTHGVPPATAHRVADLPPVSVLFATFLGYSPVERLVPAGVLHHLSQANAATLTSRGFFPQLITQPFRDGLHEAFLFAAAACLVAAVASWSRGPRQVTEPATEGTAITLAGD